MHVRNIKWTCFGLLFFFFPIVHAELWHVWYMLKNCSTVAVRSREKHLDYMQSVSTLLKQKEAHRAENHVEFKKEKLLSFYSRTAPSKSIFCTIIPDINQVKVDIYAAEKSFDREKLKNFSIDFFAARGVEQTTRYFSD